MKQLLLLASVAFAASSQTAFAEREPTAKPVFEIRYGSEVAAPTRHVTLYGAGAYTVKSFNADGTLANVVRAGLSNAKMREVRAALRAAEWNITYSRIMCFAYSPSYTQYVVRNKLMYTAQMCSGAMADDATQKSIATIESILATQ